MKGQEMNLDDLTIRHAEKYKEENKGLHVDTIYLAIQEDDNIICSKDPFIMGNAKHGFLVQGFSKWADPITYDEIVVEYISEDGARSLNKDFNVYVKRYAYTRGHKLFLTSDGICYECCPSWNNTESVRESFQSVWSLYNELKKVETMSERITVFRLYEKDEKIFQQKKEIDNFSYANALLEKERDMYKGLLDDIKELLLK